MDQKIRDLFPVVRFETYLNSAAMAPMPQVAVDAVTAQLRDVSKQGAKHVSEWIATKARVRSTVAAMLGVAADSVAFTRNTSDGLYAVAAGIEWHDTDNIVSFANEFPANYYPWCQVSKNRGVELRLCPEVGGRIDIDEFCSLIDHNTRLVTVSAVQYNSGFKLNLDRIGRTARNHGALFCVDIIQAFGAIPLDLPGQFVDVAAGASYKWLCSPEGCGIFYLNERAREKIKPASRGWTSVENAWDFHDREQPLVADSRAWETGMGGSALFYGMEESLRILNDVGIANIESHLTDVTDYLCATVAEDRFEIVSSRQGNEKSQIVALRPRNGFDSAQVVQRLAQSKIAVSRRGDCIRIAPHLFNNFEDVDRLTRHLNSPQPLRPRALR